MIHHVEHALLIKHSRPGTTLAPPNSMFILLPLPTRSVIVVRHPPLQDLSSFLRISHDNNPGVEDICVVSTNTRRMFAGHHHDSRVFEDFELVESVVVLRHDSVAIHDNDEIVRRSLTLFQHDFHFGPVTGVFVQGLSNHVRLILVVDPFGSVRIDLVYLSGEVYVVFVPVLCLNDEDALRSLGCVEILRRVRWSPVGEMTRACIADARDIEFLIQVRLEAFEKVLSSLDVYKLRNDAPVKRDKLTVRIQTQSFSMLENLCVMFVINNRLQIFLPVPESV
mmetsp:Transcript_22263/g.44658  ORF Transcript_22263/g.44658 Transcript_22263/m.44658 type:complete len:280 (-) Transcript_22263:976-1815(-)